MLLSLENAAVTLSDHVQGRDLLTTQQAERLALVNARLYTMMASFRTARRKERERLVQEALLPVDELTYTLATFCSPKELAITSQCCRHFKVVVASVIKSRVATLGLELPSWQKADAELLDRLEQEMRDVPALLVNLHKRKVRGKLKSFHDAVICFHRDALLEKLKTPHNGEMRRVDLTFDCLQMLYGPHLPATWLKEHADIFFAYTSDSNQHVRGTAINIVCDERFPRDAVIERQHAFLPILNPPAEEDYFSSRRFEVLNMLRRLPVPSLSAPMREQIERVSKENPPRDQDVRRLAREMVIRMVYSDARNGQGATTA